MKNIREFFEDRHHLAKIDVLNRVPLLNEAQNNIKYNLTVTKPGLYIILVNYITPLTNEQTHMISLKIDQNYGQNMGHLKLHNCPYTHMCRQVVLDSQGGVGIFKVDTNNFPIELKSENANVGIHSIYTIPSELWSLEYIKPSPVCIKMDGKCIVSEFRNPSESKTIQFDSEEVMRLPVGKNNNTTYVWLSTKEKAIDLKGKVSTPGPYTFIVHYYQPDFPEFDLSVIIQNGQFYEAKVPIKHCPSKSGCRSTVEQVDGNNKFYLTENFMATLKIHSDTKNVFLNYLIVTPADFYSEKNLEEEEELDRSGEFIKNCANNNFNIDTTRKGFCRDSVFSITAAHNVGALPCQCDFHGSLSFECEKFGGQCLCKPHIIGRKCEACRTGYYGFPDCKPCECPSTAYCEPETGQCICPRNVIGEKCDKCDKLTYGFDSLIGCEECNCHPLGIEKTTQCDLLNGSCACKENVEGRTCSTCKPGFYAFPHCESCDCNPIGTNPEICAQDTAECFCKKNVVGPQCDYCREGTYNLDVHNEDGCTECFCFGKTSNCMSSMYSKFIIKYTQNWKIVSIKLNGILEISNINVPLEYFDEAIGADFTTADLNTTNLYFSAPSAYIGKMLLSYGGYLNYTIFYTIGEFGSAVNGADIILKGANSYLTYSSLEQPAVSQEYQGFVQILESNFNLPHGVPSKKEHIMEILRDLRGIYIRATYWTASITTRIINPILESAIYEEDSRVYRSKAVTVEQCRCPPNYQGLSCEECAPGYYRIQSGSHGGYCQPCVCHGHATECDVNTGVCLNCTHNTKGDHCEVCEIGYHGNALGGTPNDCLICACPLPSTSNNFANSCDVSNDGERISCECEHGYIGARCQSCLPGFYGQPEQPGDFCKACQCSGNINIDEPGSCDTITGECLKCLNNTFGVACALCKPGFFGDAVNRKDCQACICDKLGINHCDSSTGTCICKPNVVGEKCDRCDVEHFGFDSGRGCSPCNCSSASDSSQCDDTTGQCKCKSGVTGTTCNRCQAGYWNYTSDGCISCRCKSEFSQGVSCNPRTGQCECMPGVIGEKCDQCPYRWVFTPSYGCHECDNCHYALLDTVDNFGALIDPIIIEFDSTNSGYFTRRRLESMEDLFKKIRPMMDDVDPRQIHIKDYLNEIESLEHDLKNLNRKSNYSLENSETLNKHSEQLHDQISELYDDILQAEEDANIAVDEIAQITFQLNDDFGTEIENAIQEGQNTFNQIKLYNLTSNEVDATKQLRKVNELLKNIINFKLPSDGMLGDVEFIKEDLNKFKAKLDDIYNNTQYSINNAMEAERVIRKTGKDHVKAKLESIENQVDLSKSNILKSENLLSNATQLMDLALLTLSEVQELPDVLDARNTEFNSYLDSYKAIDNIYNKQPIVEERAGNLSLEAQEWSEVFSENKETEDAVKAGNAYRDIIKTVNNSRSAAEESRSDTSRANSILTDISDKTYEADSKSSDILFKAHSLKTNSEDKLGPILYNVQDEFLPIKEEFDRNVDLLKELIKNLDNTQYKSLDMAYINASEQSQTAGNIISDIKELNVDFQELPNETNMVETLPKDHDELRRNLLLTDKQVVSVNDKLPDIINRVVYFPKMENAQKHKIDRIQSKIKKLNQQIELARDIANKVKVGVRFYPNTTLELKNPDNIEQLTTSVKISGYFRTPKRDGLIFYLGNPNGTNLPKTKSDDYMALVIVNGYATLKFDLGNGPDQLINEKYVSDNVWYQFIIERIGHYATVTIREEIDRKEVFTKAEKPITGHYSIFNLDKEKSKLFVGSFPPTNYEIQKEISEFNSLEGEIEDFVIGDRPISLWNFNQGYENNHGAMERDKLVDLEPSTGFRFNGNGYAILNARSYPIRHKSDIHLAFKTFASEGLLFLAGNSNTFIALELRNGKVLYQYNLGTETKKFYTSKTYNDGRWHKINAVREGTKGKLIVDGEVERDVSKQIAGSSIEAIETISFGGYPNKHNYVDVTHIKYDGCINNVTIMGQTVDLRVNIKTFDVLPGCPEKFAPMVSFTNKRPGYIGWNRLSISNDFKAALKFKTKEKDGIIFYVTDSEQTAGISLSLVDGRLKIISQKIELISKDTFNDMKWHVVSMMHNEKELRVDFDDYGYKVTDAPPPPLHILYGHMYVGGLPTKIKPLASMVGSTVQFSGCITDLTVNGAVKNFANSTEKSNEYLASCVLDKTELENLDVHKLPVLPPLPDWDFGTTLEPELTTGNPFKDRGKSRGDGGHDFVPSFGHNISATKIDEYQPSTSKPPLKVGCALPLEPTYEGESNGYRFGIKEESRLEYLVPRGKFRKQCDFDLKIKTAENNGIILFVSDQANNDQYLALLIKDGYLIFTFNTSKGPVLIKTNNKYNDDKLHLVQLSRDEKNGKLVIDNTENLNYNGEFEAALDLKPPFYVGGIPSKFYNVVFNKLNITNTFSGCVQYLRMNGKPMENPEEHNVTPCSDNVEYGTFFAGDGYVKLKERFKVGIEFDVKMDIKPRDVSGVILAVHGKKDYFVIELIDGVLQATVDNGKKPFKAFSKTSKYHLCDGNWHSIQAVKSKNVITLSVDSVFTQPQLGDRHDLSTDTGSALFLGGHRFIKRIRGIQTKKPYIGCIRNIHINNEPAEIIPSMIVGKVYAGSCRTN
ncbi:unnamed protein product [Brassicogethes aeneus]|uniref:Laminin subunit alpha n=1 Tax=Brassicogethes aeneus TaxID=1431903 RepID=A0A9P0ASK9_BRAAE|nr:unnamed protein product [Brassicogethes aeneus]